jgi:sulfite reductase alpha subunit-like flavoprotein
LILTDGLNLQGRVPVKFSQGNFRYPDDPTTPLLVIASMSGIAPVLSILDHRRSGIAPLGQCYVLYPVEEAPTEVMRELEKAKTDGLIDQLFLPVSQQEQKVDVETVITENVDLIWSLWKNEATELFYSGPALGFDSVREAMFKMIMEKTGQARLAALRDFCKHHIFIQPF